ncbi:alpha-hydroxy acid oxidase [Labrys wisconsinensis]|uniref:L-lactate dehydrogenase (Cytochrome)/(S)-mandelate dehydrogenase n=1 Tax=Labrys wisconsinensis TaxID=425677 RepID=A0ABU0JGB2_9HYPH|nr:alpha-hydroxy acid oxidase [Labrys wisconsinensis]MDQ0473334.1 L-lactate dehydrogenase (cytochrome)/(S)-mandelate dehydrogenase [Labrys wisconsinensis]
MTPRSERWREAAISIAAMRDLARRTLPRPVFDFADGGAEDERTLRRNEAAFDSIELLPRPLDGAATRDLSVELFGRRLSLPVLIGPTGLAGLFWPGGEAAAARAAAAAGTAYCLSHGSVCRLEDLPAGGPRWMQLFIYRERGFTEALAQRAAEAGYDALVLTTDNQLLGNRERDRRNGFRIPPRFRAVDLALMATKLAWLARMRPELPRITFGNYVRPGESADLAALAGRMASLLDPGMSWADVAWLRRLWHGPLLLKGVLHPEEAHIAVDHGIDGLIVSNHGGRQLDGAAAAIDALPAVLAAVEGRVPVLVDGGLRRGVDVVKALALGARACLIGRPQLWGLSVAGEPGVRHVLELYRSEIDRAMGLMGAASLTRLGPDLLRRREVLTPLTQS